MGFLDQSTNNIILDAVLTDLGREALSRNDGSFSIFKFSFGDDEVDYSHIVNFGRTVGKEKIEKNTPILEATTQANQGLKSKLVSFNNPSLTRLPTLSLVTSLDDNTALLTRSSSTAGDGESTTQTIQINQTLSGAGTADPDLSDFSYIVTLDYNFLRLGNSVPTNVDEGMVAKYVIEADATVSSQNLTSCTVSLRARNVSNDAFTAASPDGVYVYRPMTFYGVNSGASVTIQVRIS
jgi:hypothetical protein